MVYVHNFVKVVDGDFQAIADFMKSETRDFDFNNLIPMPPSILALIGNISIQSELGYMYWMNRSKIEKYSLIKSIKERGYDLHETLKEGLCRYIAYKDSGHWNVLDWVFAKWGTERNACDVGVRQSDRTIIFKTVWSAPIPIYKALAKKFPTYKISVKYYDEGGEFAGYCDIKDGDVFGEDDDYNNEDEDEEENEDDGEPV